MKIEKLNDNQIRCTLTHADLAARHLKLSELAYGTEKAKSLFRDMMQQASFDFGFEAEDIPLMIEAIPASADSIVLIITKVEDPEELAAAETDEAAAVQDTPASFNVRLFSFDSIDRVIQAAQLLGPVYHGSNTLYHDLENSLFILALTQSDHSTIEFNKICNMLSEYGSLEKASGSVLAFL